MIVSIYFNLDNMDQSVSEKDVITSVRCPRGVMSDPPLAGFRK